MGRGDRGRVAGPMGAPYRRRGSRYWWIWWRDSTGKIHCESTKSLNRRVATLKLSVRESQAIREEAGLSPRSIALADAVGEYLDAHPPPIWSEKWHATVSYWWRARLIPDLGGPDVLVSGVDRSAVESAQGRWLAA